ncbi:MAG: riboflavin synthase, partial [Ignavibacteriales bacterium]|nr:riboflavin synthase [Ignavibacteriales bacterium]
GKITNKESIAGGYRFTFSAKKIFDDLKINNSVSVNGVCLTVTNIIKDNFTADAVGDTLKKTTLQNLTISTVVNLERALRLSDRLGGHIVAGHVNEIGKISEVKKLGENYYIIIEISNNNLKYVVKEGSIAIDGISLTVAEVNENKIGLSIIPHTWNNTNLYLKRIGDNVNIEVDILSKYIENIIIKNETNTDRLFSVEWLKKMGY